MNSVMQKLLEHRQQNKCCIICGKNCGETNTPSIILHHFVLGNVEVCEKHIKEK